MKDYQTSLNHTEEDRRLLAQGEESMLKAITAGYEREEEPIAEETEQTAVTRIGAPRRDQKMDQSGSRCMYTSTRWRRVVFPVF